MDSLYVRFKFGMTDWEFAKLALLNPKLYDLEFDGAVERYRQTSNLNGVVSHVGDIYMIKDRHKFIDWAKSCGLYNEADIQNLEYLICGELMKEMM